MSNHEKTSPRVARKAAQVLRNASVLAETKSIASGTLSQARSKKATSAKVATRAGNILGAGGATRAVKSLAASVLAQRPDAKKKRAPAETVKKAARVAASALTQHVTTRRTAEGKPMRVVLTPYRGGSLRRDRVESVVSTVLAKHKKK